MDLFSLIELICGLTLFLFGMKVMSGNLEKMAGGKLERSLKKVTTNPFISIGIGAIITIAMQSSSASTVMMVGLVNSGILAFSDTIFFIFGANIGTTLTSWILSMSGITSENILIQMLKPENFSPILALIGVLMLMLANSDRKKSVGNVFIGFMILIYGMEFMSNAVSPIAELPWFADVVVQLTNPFVALLAGAIFTGIIQGSAAALGILQALSLTGAITFEMAIPLIMGINIGTCVTSLLSSIGTNTAAKRVATVHITVNAIGAVVFLPLIEILDMFIGFEFLRAAISPVTIAVVHTVFNMGITVLFLPLKNPLVKFIEFIVKDKKEADGQTFAAPFVLDDRLIRTPSVAIRECDTSSKNMFRLAHSTLIGAIAQLKDYDKKAAEQIRIDEDTLDHYEDALGTALVKLSGQAISEADSKRVSKVLHAIGDFERLGDHATGILKAAKEIKDKKITFSASATHELEVLTNAIIEILDITLEAYCNNDLHLAAKVEPLEQTIDKLKGEIKAHHIARLQEGKCSIEQGFILSDMLTGFERISDHCSNIAVAIIEVEHGEFDTHRYLNGIKYGNNEFNSIYDNYVEKYTI